VFFCGCFSLISAVLYTPDTGIFEKSRHPGGQ
jgi:hypothetical protein